MKKLLTFALVAFGSYALALEKNETTEAMINNALTEICNAGVNEQECQDLRAEIENELARFENEADFQEYLNSFVTKCTQCQKQKEKQKQNAQ